MPVHYWGLAPEVNAIRLTTGPGAAALAPVIAAYQTAGVIHIEQGAQMLTTAATTVADSWQGQGGTAMMAAAVPKSEWHIEAGGHAEKASVLISEAAASHASAVAGTIPYPVVIANRVREMTLQSTNFLGVNTPAIIETNVEYSEFWAQNATAMTTYASAAAGIAAGLSVPLRPAMMSGANPAALAADAVGMSAGLAQSGLQASTQGLGAPLQGAAQAVSSAVPATLSTATGAGTAARPGGAEHGGDAATPGSPLAQPGSTDLLSAGQSMMGAAGSAPQALQAMTSPLSQVAQPAQLISGPLSGMLGGMPGLSGGPGAGGLTAGAPGSNLAASVAGVNGGYGSGGGPVSAALSKGGAGTGGPVGLPSAWWGPASAPDGAGAAGPSKHAAAARAGAPAVGATGAPMGSGMYGMPPAGAAGQHRDRSTAARGGDDTSRAVLLEGVDAIPILTADGVVYTDGGG